MKLIGIILCSVFALLAGCASTSIDTPIGMYRSTRDASLDELMIVIDRQPDGGEHTEVMVGGARGEASPVIEAQSAFLRALFEAAFESGMRAATR